VIFKFKLRTIFRLTSVLEQSAELYWVETRVALSAGPQPAARSWEIWVPLHPHFEKRVVNRTQRGGDAELVPFCFFQGVNFTSNGQGKVVHEGRRSCGFVMPLVFLLLPDLSLTVSG
jgi:hypothetical protein